jgi:hypothetical protein
MITFAHSNVNKFESSRKCESFRKNRYGNLEDGMCGIVVWANRPILEHCLNKYLMENIFFGKRFLKFWENPKGNISFKFKKIKHTTWDPQSRVSTYQYGSSERANMPILEQFFNKYRIEKKIFRQKFLKIWEKTKVKVIFKLKNSHPMTWDPHSRVNTFLDGGSVVVNKHIVYYFSPVYQSEKKIFCEMFLKLWGISNMNADLKIKKNHHKAWYQPSRVSISRYGGSVRVNKPLVYYFFPDYQSEMCTHKDPIRSQYGSGAVWCGTVRCGAVGCGTVRYGTVTKFNSGITCQCDGSSSGTVLNLNLSYPFVTNRYGISPCSAFHGYMIGVSKSGWSKFCSGGGGGGSRPYSAPMETWLMDFEATGNEPTNNVILVNKNINKLIDRPYLQALSDHSTSTALWGNLYTPDARNPRPPSSKHCVNPNPDPTAVADLFDSSAGVLGARPPCKSTLSIINKVRIQRCLFCIKNRYSVAKSKNFTIAVTIYIGTIAAINESTIGMYRNNIMQKAFLFLSNFRCKFFEIREWEHYNYYQGACANFLAKFISVRIQYRGEQYHFIGMSRHNSPSKGNFFCKFRWCDFFVIEDCVHYNDYPGAYANFLVEFLLVYTQHRGAHYHLVCMRRQNITSKKIFFNELQWCEYFEMRECGQYKGYQGVCAKILSKSFSVHPQYRGAHSQFSGISRQNITSKIIFFLKSLWCEVFEKRECVSSFVCFNL